MKKIYTTLLTLAAATSLTLSAQQLPNADFSQWESSCGSSDAMGTMMQRPGNEPSDWFGSSVNQTVMGISKQETLITNDNGVRLENKFVGITFLGKQIGSTAPAYISLGTPWVYAESNVNNCDGGTYGGMDFKYRPDAIKAEVKRTDSNDEASHIIVYSWKGTFKSKIGKKGSPTSERDDVDRAIMGTTSTESGSTGSLIASADYSFTTTGSNNQTVVVPLEYKSTDTPEKINVIISAGDYWTRGNMKENTTLYAYNVSLLYYSRLESVSINGTPIDNFASDKYDYSVESTMPAESAFSFATLGNSKSSTAKLELDQDNAIAKITVTNSNAGGNDIDGESQHIYTIQFKENTTGDDSPVYGGNVYGGSLSIAMNNSTVAESIESNIHIIPTGAESCTFVLPNFTLPEDVLGWEVPLGDIVVENVSATLNGTSTEYTGTVKNFMLADDSIDADINLTGTVDAEGKAIMHIDVIWHMPLDEGGYQDVPIGVDFNGNFSYAGIGGIEADNTDAPVEYYNLQGVRIAADNLTPGIYIRRQGTEVTKILIRK